MEPRVSIITLGVADLGRAVAFYQAMGLTRYDKIAEDVAFFQIGGAILALWGRDELARDTGVEFGKLPAPVALAYNTRSEDEVDAVLARAERASGRVVKPAGRVFWGGRQGYFTDPDGHLWEVAHNAQFPLDAAGNISLP